MINWKKLFGLDKTAGRKLYSEGYSQGYTNGYKIGVKATEDHFKRVLAAKGIDLFVLPEDQIARFVANLNDDGSYKVH